MKSLLLALCALLLLHPAGFTQSNKTNNAAFNAMLSDYHEETQKLSPLNATFNGDNRYNDQLPVEFTDSYRKTLAAFNQNYLAKLAGYNRNTLSENDQLSYDVLKWKLQSALEGLKQKDNLFPFTQFTGMPLMVAQFGSGTVIQPFKSVADYDNWIKRASGFTAWADSAIIYFRRGIKEKFVLPKVLVAKMIPQMQGFVATDVTKSVFYGPIKNLPADFSDADKTRLTNAYTALINEQLMPAYQRLANFLKDEYLPASRSTTGLKEIPGGDQLYKYLVKQITTTDKTPEQIFNIGIAEVKRIRTEMEKIKESVGFSGDLATFFKYMQTDPKFFPYKNAEEVLNDYRAIQPKIETTLAKMFLHKPKTPFEIRQTEAFRAATSAAQYASGLPDGSRPGIFYVPIVDATRTTAARESLFIHEAIPGHHYQIMLQRENENLPAFRRFTGFTAYVEGWGLYSEGLGTELGLYTDPYQHMRALGDEIHRAIRLVVDVGMHAKGWTREQAIQYTMENEPIEEQRAISETERYMAIPAQALSYKIGGLKIQELRKKYEKQLGSNFNIAAFHDAILRDGSLPLDLLEKKMEVWARTQTVKKAF